MSGLYAKLNDEGNIEYVAFGDVPEEGDFISVDLSSELYKNFYNMMPEWAHFYIPEPLEA